MPIELPECTYIFDNEVIVNNSSFAEEEVRNRLREAIEKALSK